MNFVNGAWAWRNQSAFVINITDEIINMSFTDNDSGFSGLCSVVSDNPIDINTLTFKLSLSNTTVSPYCGMYIGIGDYKKTGSASTDYFETMRNVIATYLDIASITDEEIELDLSNYQGKYLYFALEYGKSVETLAYNNNNWNNTVNGTTTVIIDFDVTPPPPPTGEFPITIQKNNSEPIHLTKDLTDILSTNVWLKEDTSIIDPVFVLEATLSDLIEANYVTVPTFGRSYFITNITSISTDLVELTCHVDVLSSFADEIKANKGIIFRQENDWNLYLNDGVIQAYQDPIITTQLFPKGFTDQNFVFITAGSRGDLGMEVGEGGLLTPEDTGDGNNESKTTGGLSWYAQYNLGNPYWMGTFGNLASADLLNYKRHADAANYPTPGDPDFSTQYGQRVHDCVGLIKGYRWRDYPYTGDPNYVAEQDVNVVGLYSQCNRYRGDIARSPLGAIITDLYEGCCVFYGNLQHVGVYIGNGKVIEAKGHHDGVVETNLVDRTQFTLWGIPDWLKITTTYA